MNHRSEAIRDFIATHKAKRGAFPSARTIQKEVGGDTHAILVALAEARGKDKEMSWKERIASLLKNRDDAAAQAAELTRELSLMDRTERTERASALLAEAALLLSDERTEQRRSRRASLESRIAELESELDSARESLSVAEAGFAGAEGALTDFHAKHGRDADSPVLSRQRHALRSRRRQASERIAAAESRLEAARAELDAPGDDL